MEKKSQITLQRNLTNQQGIKENLTKIFGKDLTDEIANGYIHQMFEHVNIDENDDIEGVGKKLYQFYYETGKELFGPLFTDFVFRTLKNYEKSGKILFLERDGIIFYEIAKQLLDQYPEEFNLNKDQIDLILLTRKFLGIADEIAQFEEKEIDLNSRINPKNYLKEKGVTPESLLVDTGCYGSIIERLYCDIYGKDKSMLPGTVFLVSKNPNITGYTTNRNQLSLEDQALLLDAVECQVPKMYHSPSIEDLSLVGNKLLFTPRMIDYVHDMGATITSGMLQGIKDSIKDAVSDQGKGEELFLKKIISSPKLIIPSQTPTRSGKEMFLRNREKLGIGKIKDYVNGFNS